MNCLFFINMIARSDIDEQLCLEMLFDIRKQDDFESMMPDIKINKKY